MCPLCGEIRLLAAQVNRSRIALFWYNRSNHKYLDFLKLHQLMHSLKLFVVGASGTLPRRLLQYVTLLPPFVYCFLSTTGKLLFHNYQDIYPQRPHDLRS
jgi:hypothetical protein